MPADLAAHFPRLARIAIVGYPAPREDMPGHDLTYLPGVGLLSPPQLPRTLLADLAGAERAVTAALALLLARERGALAGAVQVALAEAAGAFADPLRYGLTLAGGILGGAFPGYNLYRTGEGWLAVGALEPHFWRRLGSELGLEAGAGGPGREQLERVFLTETARHWEEWGAARDLPLRAVRDPHAAGENGP